MKKNGSRGNMLLAAMMLAAAGNPNFLDRYYRDENGDLKDIRCGICKNFPNGGFCKLNRHHVSKFTPAYKCGFFKKK